MTEGKGWHGAPFVPHDGQHWSLGFAAQMLDIPEEDLRKILQVLNNAGAQVEPSGTIRMNTFSRQGRQPRAYPANKLIAMCEGFRKLADELSGM